MIINGDCLDELKRIDDNSVDCIVTSPPYNLQGLKGNKTYVQAVKWNGKYQSQGIVYQNDDLPESEYQQWQIDILNECYRILKPTGSLFYNHKIRRFKNKCYHPLNFIEKTNLNFYQEIVWDRRGCHIPSAKTLGQSTERIFWLTKTTRPFVNSKSDLMWKCEVWSEMSARGKARPNHPAPYPINIPINCIKLTTQPGYVVLDPFMGSGTTGLAAQQLNRQFIGIEIDANYCQLAQNRGVV